MKIRLLTAVAVTGVLSLSTVGAHAATPVLDGKKVKVLTLTAVGAPQDHDADLVTGVRGDGPERVSCVAPRCARLPFRYQPAKGVTGNVAFQLTWTVPAADIDLFIAEIGQDGSSTELAACGTSSGTSEKIYLAAASFKSGKTYALIADFYRTANETVKATVTMPGSNSVKTTVPANVDNLQKVNCGM